MKYLLSILFFHGFFIAASQNTYWVESEEIDSFILINLNEQREIILRQKIVSDRKENTQFLFKSKNVSNTYIQLFCNDCDDLIQFTILTNIGNEQNDIIELKSGEKINLEKCINKNPKKNNYFFIQFYDYLIHIYNRINVKPPTGRRTQILVQLKQFLNTSQIKIPKRRRTPILRGGEKPKAQEPKVYFGFSDYSYYWDTEGLSIPFQIFEKYPIKSIYIISHEGELILGAGDGQSLSEVFNLEGKIFPSIDKIIRPILDEKEDRQTYQLESTMLQEYLFKKIETGQWYQLGIELKNDETEYNPYLFNFQLITPEEKTQLETFFITPDRSDN